MAAAHSLKGSAASLGIESIRSLAETVEQAGHTAAIAAGRQALPVLNLLDQLAALGGTPCTEKRRRYPNLTGSGYRLKANGGPAQGVVTVTAE